MAAFDFTRPRAGRIHPRYFYGAVWHASWQPKFQHHYGVDRVVGSANINGGTHAWARLVRDLPDPHAGRVVAKWRCTWPTKKQ